jgi:hypothetical protein
MDLLKKLKISEVDLLISQNPEKHILSLGANDINLSQEINTFNLLKNKIQDSVNQIDKSEFIKLVELGKSYEKALKNAEKSMLEIEKSKVINSLRKLDDTFHNYFDIKQIQERKLNCLELLIKHENVAFMLKNKLNFSHSSGYVTCI